MVKLNLKASQIPWASSLLMICKASIERSALRTAFLDAGALTAYFYVLLNQILYIEMSAYTFLRNMTMDPA